MTAANTIRNKAAFRWVLPYDEMRESAFFGRPSIYPQDIDGEVEYNGYFLYFEWKAVGATVEAAEWSATSKRLFLLGKRGCCFYVYHQIPQNDRIVPSDIVGMRIARKDSWLVGHKPAVRLTKRSIPCHWLELQRWCVEWSNHVDEKPNSFVTDFRKLGPFVEADMSTPFWGSGRSCPGSTDRRQ